MRTETSGFIRQAGPWIPCLKEGESVYTFTPEELSDLLRRAYADGYESAKEIYYMPEVTKSISSSWNVVKETERGTN